MTSLEANLNLLYKVQQACDIQARYRVLWVIGPPRCGKSTLMKRVCIDNNWQYINFTLDPTYFDALSGFEDIYRPDDFKKSLDQWCLKSVAEVVVIDEIEPLLSLWTSQQCNLFFQLIGRASRLPVGVVIVSRRISFQELVYLVPSPNHIFVVEGD